MSVSAGDGQAVGDVVGDLRGVVQGPVSRRDVRSAVDLSDGGVHGEGQELTKDDHHLVQGHQGAADALGRGLPEEDRDGSRGASDGEAKNDPEDVEHPDVDAQGTAHGPEEEDNGQQRDVVTTTVLVAQLAAHRGTQRGAQA
ncbi:MAG: hypothetical protein Q605_AUC01001G0004 [Actinomyces urogenitalis DORA_12]|uniref:Uncharacterized protein n=1 Tax=Actinomyces urogenitalis DORA_12 TaxID=1403939 RepID=W1VBK2_9ACTO|nr:MAG: hypothetical protein Q605_AUC01001G0004 [Actinomyces urogenitalis DORA_12]